MTIKMEEDWRTLCKLIADEQDPHHLSELVDQLLKAIDERKKRLGVGVTMSPDSNPFRGET
jgi:hypothetical protein